MPRRKKMSLQDVIRIGTESGVEEISVDGMTVKFRVPEPEIPEQKEETMKDWKEEELKILLHSTDLESDYIKKMSQ